MPQSQLARRNEVARKGRHYQLFETGENVPSVTNILGVIGKPALVPWAANMERTLCLDAAADLNDDLPAGGPKMSRPGYITTLDQRIGKTKAHKKELDKAAEIGSQAHALIEWKLQSKMLEEVGTQPKVSQKAMWAYTAWENFEAEVNLEPMSGGIEQTIWSLDHRYAGTMDLYAEFDITESLVARQPESYRDELSQYIGTRQKSIQDWKTGKRIYLEAGLQIAAYRQAMIEMGHADETCFGIIVRLPKVETDPDFEVRLYPLSELTKLFTAFLHVKKVWEWVRQEEDKK